MEQKPKEEDPELIQQVPEPAKLAIADIFSATGLSSFYTKEQKLKFIFNYGDYEFVFMTTTHLFVFDYAKFSCAPENGVKCARILADFEADERGASIYANHLFENHASETADIADLPIESNKTSKRNVVEEFDYMKLLILIFLFFFIVLLVLNLIKGSPLKGTYGTPPSKLSRKQSNPGGSYPSNPSETTSIDASKDLKSARSLEKAPQKSVENVKSLSLTQKGVLKSVKSVKSNASLTSQRSIKSIQFFAKSNSGRLKSRTSLKSSPRISTRL